MLFHVYFNQQKETTARDNPTRYGYTLSDVTAWNRPERISIDKICTITHMCWVFKTFYEENILFCYFLKGN